MLSLKQLAHQRNLADLVPLLALGHNLFLRVILNGMQVDRFKPDARYSMIKHGSDKMNPSNECRSNLINQVDQRWKQDGLNSLRYKVVKREKQPLFTWIFVDLLETESLANLTAEHIC